MRKNYEPWKKNWTKKSENCKKIEKFNLKTDASSGSGSASVNPRAAL